MVYHVRWQATVRLSQRATGPGHVCHRFVSSSRRHEQVTPVENRPRIRYHDPQYSPQQKDVKSSEQPTNFSLGPRGNKSRRLTSPKKQRDVLSHTASWVDVQVDGTTQPLSSVGLRDLCSCPLCIDPSTRQKLFYTPDIPAHIKTRDPVYTPESVLFKWMNDIPGFGDDHVTEISLDTFRKLTTSGRITTEQTLPDRTLWDAQTYSQQVNDYDYDTYMQDDAMVFKAVQELHTHGLLFVKNVPEDEESVVKIGERIGPLKTTFYGKTWDVRSVPEAKNVAYTAQNLGFHMDLMYMKQPPHLQLLHCIRSSSAGGASLFCDAFKAAEDLSKEDLGSFLTLSILRTEFHYDHPENYYHQSRMVMEQKPVHWGGTHLQTWTQALAMRERYPDNRFLQNLTVQDFLEHVAWSPPFQAPFKLDGDPSRDPDLDVTDVAQQYSGKVRKWHAAAQKFNALIHKPEVIYERLMKPGECVIFDNRRVLHARKAFEVGDVGKERWLKGAYIDKDPYMSKMKVLGDRFGNVERSVAGKAKEVMQKYWDAAA